ncbi:hypothetical protein Q5752_002924 [Cryptotrichosporon argae]
MTSTDADANALPTASVLADAARAEVFDKDGAATTFGALTAGHRVVAIFVRHFWCNVCQAYCEQLGRAIPPANLPAGTSVIIIGCGHPSFIPMYSDKTSSPYPVYANPSLSLYKAFGFRSSLAASKKGEEKDYEKALGGVGKRTWDGIKAGPLREPWNALKVGPKSQNGGEVVLEPDGSCSFIHRMQHTVDHTELATLAHAIGVSHVPQNEALPACCVGDDC